jgi:hypothetical protein
MVRITIALDETLWRRLRHLAEEKRTRGHASVSAVILEAVHQLCAPDQGRTSSNEPGCLTRWTQTRRAASGVSNVRDTGCAVQRSTPL